MALRVVGAGLGRTGTYSLKLALERLLGEPCYHMREVFGHPEHVQPWHDAALGRPPDWDQLFDGYGATVDMPACHFWREISEAYPDAVILLSTRTDAATWWASADATIMNPSRNARASGEAWPRMWVAVCEARFSTDFDDAETMMAAYDAHNASVIAEAPPERLVRYQAGDGWGPLCAALGLRVPEEPFPHLNTREEWGRPRD